MIVKVTGYSLLINIHEKYYLSFSSCRIQACMRLTLPLKKLHWPVTAVLVEWAEQCLRLTVRVRSTDFGVSYFLLEEHLTVYYTVFEFYEDRRRAARRVFAETTYHF